jgi:hypothetical protein
MKLKLKLWHGITLGVLLMASLVWAADSRITDLTELTSGSIAGGDWLACVDTSNTTDNAAGSSRKCAFSSAATYFWNAPLFSAGSASANSWPKYTSGSLLTTAEEGAAEYAEPVQYFTPDNDGGRAIAPACHTLYLNADFTGTAGTGSQQIFPTATDRITLKAATTYRFKLFMSVTNGATTATKALHFNGGTATFTAIRYRSIGQNVAVNTSGTAQSSTHVDQATSTVVLATGTSSWWIEANGGMTINASGTFFPQFAFSANPTGTVLIKRGSYMEICPIGGTADVAVGSWQ